MNKRKNLKKIMIVFSVIALLGAGSATVLISDAPKQQQESVEPSISNWQKFSSSDDRFKVSFPEEPKIEDKETKVGKKTIQYKELTADVKDASYCVTYLDFPGTWKLLGSNTLLKKSFSKMVENSDNVEEILYQKLMKHNGNPALDYAMKKDGKEVYGRLVVVGNTLYFLSASSPQAQPEKESSETFLNSFEAQK